MFATGESVGLAEWIIDATGLVLLMMQHDLKIRLKFNLTCGLFTDTVCDIDRSFPSD